MTQALWEEPLPWARGDKRQPVPGDRFKVRITDLGSRSDSTKAFTRPVTLDEMDMAKAMWEEEAGRLRPWKAVPSPEV